MTSTSSVSVSAPFSVEQRSGNAAQLRVLLVTEAAGAGVGRHFLDLAQGLATRGIEVCGVYAKARMDEQFASRIAATDPSYPPLFPLEMHRAVGLHDWRSARRLAEFIRARGPFDLVHAHSSKAGAIVRWAVWGTRMPVVYTPHAFITLDPELGRMKRLAFGLAERILARHRPQRIIAVGQEEAEHAHALGIHPDQVRVVLNGVQPRQGASREELRRRWQVPEEAVVMGFVGRLNKQKSPLTLVRVMEQLAPKHPNLRLAIVGSGPFEAEMRARFDELQLASRVVWLGPVDGAEQMVGFDLFCLPSLYEGMPYVILEALDAGLPIVATRVGNIASVVRDAVNGQCVPPGDDLAFIRAIDQIVGDDGLRRQLAAGSQARRGEYSVERMVTETLRVYAELLNRTALA